MENKETNNEILNALSQIPELVKRTIQVLEDNDALRKLTANVMKQRVQAEVPDTEIQRITSAAVKAVASTRCVLPSDEMVANAIAEGVIHKMDDSIKENATQAVKEAVKNTPVRHIFTYARTSDLLDVADQKLGQRIKILCGIVACLILIIATGGILYSNSATRWGRKYLGIIRSEMISDSEKTKMLENTYTVGILPQEFKARPRQVKKEIRQCEDIIERRAALAKKAKTDPSNQ